MSPRAASLHHRCWVEINLEALRQNADVLRGKPGVELMAVIKANAYGHGAAAVARALQGRVALLAVANLREAEEIEVTKVAAPILLLSTCLPEEREAVLRDQLRFCVSSLEEAAAWDAAAGKLGVRGHGHVMIDTGMGRMGFPEAGWGEGTARSLLGFSKIEWESLASHLPVADDDPQFTKAQMERFRQCVEKARAAGLRPRWVHLDNSIALLAYPQTAEFCNLARPGLALYGIAPLPAYQDRLRPVLVWKTRVTLVRKLPAGQGVSYGRTEILKRDSIVATLGCGYADGYPRQVSGRGAAVLIRGARCPVLGRVTMDQTMVDVTDLAPGIEAGDEAVLIGTDGGQTVTVNEVAAQAGTIPWHIFTGITARVERVLV